MKFGFIGLGRMGLNMVYNVLDSKKHTVVAYNRHPQKVEQAVKAGAIGAHSIEEVCKKVGKRKIIWLMITAGKPVDDVIAKLLPYLNKGDIIIDGGNSWFEDSKRRAAYLKRRGIGFLDVGTSGGLERARHGACMMIGGEKEVFKKVQPLFNAMCTQNGYSHMGKSGAGHFVKMVHNGIEYGMVGAINEGFEALKKHQKKFGYDLAEVSKVYAHGSIIQSRLMGWLYEAYRTGMMQQVSCKVPKGETEDEMTKLTKMAQMPILKQAIAMRKKSRTKQFCCSAIAAMRNLWGGHKVVKR